jgi:hypothetical protein
MREKSPWRSFGPPRSASRGTIQVSIRLFNDNAQQVSERNIPANIELSFPRGLNSNFRMNYNFFFIFSASASTSPVERQKVCDVLAATLDSGIYSLLPCNVCYFFMAQGLTGRQLNGRKRNLMIARLRSGSFSICRPCVGEFTEAL